MMTAPNQGVEPSPSIASDGTSIVDHDGAASQAVRAASLVTSDVDCAARSADDGGSGLDTVAAPPARPHRQTLASEGAWEDVPSSDEEIRRNGRMSRGSSASGYTRDESRASAFSSRLASMSRDDMWEDDSDSSASSESGQSSATEAPKRDNGNPLDGKNRSVRRRPSQMSSNRRAMHDYKQSKAALLNTCPDNLVRYRELVGNGDAEGEGDEPTPDRGALANDRGGDGLDAMDPFVAGPSTESYDDADAASGRFTTRSSSADAADRNGHTDASYETSDSNDDSADRAKDSLLRFAPEEYASQPPSPAVETANGSGWITSNDSMLERSSEAGLAQGASVPTLDVITENGDALPISVPATPRISVTSVEDGGAPSVSPTAKTRRPSATPRTSRELTPELISSQLDQIADAAPPMTLWDYLKEEVMATDFDNTQELKWERVTNFMSIPFHMEKIMLFGFLVCLDSFLYTFTILPLRFAIALISWMRNLTIFVTSGQRRYLHSAHKCDILKALLIVTSCWMLSRLTDASKMYHSVRGQDVIKLYVIFNVLEIADRLCCSFGQDLLDSLFSRVTLARRRDGRQPYLRPLGFFALSLCYVFAHTLVLLYQLVTLNVAINSYDNALLTLLLSNQFVEIKGSVFKKFEKENLFQLTCADIVERFQLTLMLCSIGLRNLIEMTGAAGNSVAAVQSTSSVIPSSVKEAAASAANESGASSVASSIASSSLSALAMLGPLPTSFTVFPSFSLLETIFTPVLIVLASECLVDWLKHAFITKFNHIRPTVYGRFMDVLCRDLVVAGSSTTPSSSRKRKHAFVDQSPVVSRRLGFAAVPLACLLVRMASQIMSMLKDDSQFDECASPDWAEAMSGANGEASGITATILAAWHLLRRPLVLLARPFFSDPAAYLDSALAFLGRAMAWILTGLLTWIFLIAFKLVLGTNLVSFASRRFSTLAEREREEELNSRGRTPIGMDKDEREYNATVAKLVDRTDDDATRLTFSGQPIRSPQLPASAKLSEKSNYGPPAQEKAKSASSLMDVSRYTMVRSRIW